VRIAAARKRGQHVFVVKAQRGLEIRRLAEGDGNGVVIAGRALIHQAVGLANEFRVVGHCDKVEWALDLMQTAIDHDFLALGEAVGIVGRQAGAGDESIHGHAGMYMCLAEISVLERVFFHFAGRLGICPNGK
jgi:hypothetical protein